MFQVQIHGTEKSSNSRRGLKRGKVDVGPKTGVELRFYQRGEWNRLSQAQKDECIAIRQLISGMRKWKEANFTTRTTAPQYSQEYTKAYNIPYQPQPSRQKKISKIFPISYMKHVFQNVV